MTLNSKKYSSSYDRQLLITLLQNEKILLPRFIISTFYMTTCLSYESPSQHHTFSSRQVIFPEIKKYLPFYNSECTKCICIFCPISHFLIRYKLFKQMNNMFVMLFQSSLQAHRLYFLPLMVTTLYTISSLMYYVLLRI